MRSVYSFILLSVISLLAFSCKNDNITNVGVGIQPKEDAIIVGVDTFHLSSESFFVDKIYARPDSFLLGSFYDSKYGTTHADILAQFRFPFSEDGFRFPANAVVDSLILSLGYDSWFGAENSTMAVSIYRMNKDNIFEYSGFYPSDLDPNDYVDFTQPNVLLGERIFTAKDATGTKDSTRIVIHLSEAFKDDLGAILKDTENVKNQDDFQKKFNGMFITSEFGDATMMHIRNRGINAFLYYHYETTVEGRDTIFNNFVTLPANNEVTQVNRFQHPDTAQIKANLLLRDSITYISSPANIYTRINLPVRKIVKNMLDSIDNKKLMINNATIRVDVTEIPEDDLDTPVPTNVLLLQESDVNRFFSKNNLENDSVIHSDYYKTDTTAFYQFSVAKLISNEIKKVEYSSTESGLTTVDVDNIPESINLVLVPVRINATYSSSGVRTITGIKQQILMGGATLRSGKNEYSPLRISTVYSGF